MNIVDRGVSWFEPNRSSSQYFFTGVFSFRHNIEASDFLEENDVATCALGNNGELSPESFIENNSTEESQASYCDPVKPFLFNSGQWFKFASDESFDVKAKIRGRCKLRGR